jgi:hypothetical protein
VAEATPELIDLVQQILKPAPDSTLIVADAEHFAGTLIRDIHQRTGFDLLVPMPAQASHKKRWQSISEEQFQRRWAGFATAKVPYAMRRRSTGDYFEFVQRTGERRDEWHYKGFLSTSDRDEVYALTSEFPKRWHLEEFFNANQALGWDRAGTMNLNIRYGQMSMALIAQAAIHQLRQRLGDPLSNWDADHLAQDLFFRLEGDVRVTDDTIFVTYYNAPHAERLQSQYENLPDKLRDDGIAPEIPWLYNYKLDFRFK